MIGYEFKDKSLRKKAFTHISRANEMNIESNQRLEFLGDSILSLIVAEYIYENHPNYPEGKLTELRAAIVCEKTLAEIAKELGLGDELVFGRSETRSNGKEKASILADTFEALLAAIYLDSDMETAKKWTLNVIGKTLENANGIDLRNYKSEIQTYFQKRDKSKEVVGYKTISKDGPDHAPRFKVEAIYKGRVIGGGKGKNRKVAEQNAAKDALEKLHINKKY